MREKRIFIGLSDRFAKPLSSEGFARVDFSGDNHRGGSRSPDHCGDYCSTQKSVHNLGYTAAGNINNFNPGIMGAGSNPITSLTYNQANRLAKVLAGTSNVAAYTYD